MYPIFISDKPDLEQEIPTLPGQKRWGVNKLEAFVGGLVKKGLKSVILFGVPENLEKVRWREHCALDGQTSDADRHVSNVDSFLKFPWCCLA